MTRQSPPELFASERPVRSDFSREKSYARRRKITLVILALIIGATVYVFVGHRAPNPADIPTLHAENGDYKQKPANPGGIDIPHQDVRVYDQLENKNGTPTQIEHLLPPPEKPKDMPVPTPEPPVPATPVATTPVPVAPTQTQNIIPTSPTKPVATTVTPIPVVVPSAPAKEITPKETQKEITIEQVLKDTASSSPTQKPMVSGTTSIQLASIPDEAKARAMTQDLQKKFAAQLGGAMLQPNRADLGSRGIFYRIQSQPMSETDATRICAAIKQQNSGCILVRK